MIDRKQVNTAIELLQREIGHLTKQLGEVKDVAVQIAIHDRINHLEQSVAGLQLIPTF